MALISGALALVFLTIGSYYYLSRDPYPHHVYALPTTTTNEPPDMDCLPNQRSVNTLPEPMQLTAEDQRAFIAISVKGGVECTRVKRVLKRALKRKAYSDRQVERLYQEYATGVRASTNRCPVPGRPVTATDQDHEDTLNELMSESRTWRIEELAEVLEISVGSVYTLLVKNGYRKVGPVWLPHELSCSDKRKRLKICRDNLARYRRDPDILNRIISLDESWMRCYIPQDPQQAKEWREKDEKP